MPVLDLSSLEPLKEEIKELQARMDDIDNKLATHPIYQMKPEPPQETITKIHRARKSLEKDKRELSSMQYQKKNERDDLERSLIGEWKVMKRDRENQVYRHQECLQQQAQQRFWRSKFQELRDSTSRGTTTLHRSDEGDVIRAEGFPDNYGGLVPPQYKVDCVVLNPDKLETLDKLKKNQVGVFVCGDDDGHWTSLLENERGGLDHMNDSRVTRSYFRDMTEMLDYYLWKVDYGKKQVTAIFP